MKFFVIGICFLIFSSCSGGAGKSNENDTTMDAIVNGTGTPIDSIQNIGKNLIAVNDCLTCHKVAEKSFGPSYSAVANKYDYNQGNIENLASRIVKGGKGLWGQNAMTPHSNLTESDAQIMVRYILSLRNLSDTTK